MTISKAMTGFGSAQAPADRPKTAGAASIACHDYAVPPFVEAELRHLYGSLFSSLAHYRVFGGAKNTSTYRVYEQAS
ncbi:MAG TPA: hypothetical protein VHK70_00860 [Burkholderiaceae bacterium]|jgi:hypothetical protein|nr:hypothetical protein [Burkholderiaceae bacterium]